ncbi:hypothetical protein B9G55_16585 [Saccharibacillus sp. O16]|nr:hypothetical protein B9G55_16585 [Saccharibacillus sp. O16]
MEEDLPLSVRKKIREINQIRDQLSQKNRDYFDEVIVRIRFSRVQEESGEDWLLARAQELLAAQKKGKTAIKLFGEDPIAYADAAAANLPQRKAPSRARLMLIAPWAALSWTFLLLGIAALIAPEAEQVNIGALVIVVIGALALVGVLMSLIRRDPEEGVPAPPKFNIRSVGMSLLALLIVGAVGVMVLQVTPVVTIPYWLSFALAIVGFTGQVFMLRRR